MKSIFIIFFILIIIIGCSVPGRPGGLIVVVTILPLAEMAERIAGERAEIVVLVPPGASPHAYEPTPEQMIMLSRARCLIKVGTPIEFETAWLDRIIANNPDLFVIDASASIELIQGPAHEHDPEEKPENHGLHPDPHIWNSLRNARIMVENIYQGLAAVDPGNRIYYRTNEKKYLRQLDSLDRAIERLLAGKTRRSFMVYHPAWTYLALDYNLTQIPVAALGKEPTARGIEALIEQARRSQTRVVFASPQFSTKSAEVIAREIDGRVIMIDPLARDYLENMKRIAQTLAQTME